MELFLHYLTMPYLLWGIVFTIEVTVLGLLGGLVLGVVLAAMQLSRFKALAMLARGYTIIFRGTPLILQLVFAYDALPHLGLKLSALAAAGLALAANEAPFIAEIVRAGVRSVDRGQVLAGEALGMRPFTLMRHVVSPQAIRFMVPAFGNETISALKNSSLASVIAVQELTLRSTQLASSTFDFFSIFFASGLMYLALTGAVAAAQLMAEVMLDLDHPTPQARFARLMPWRRVAAEEPVMPADGEPPTETDVPSQAPPHLAVDRAKRVERLADAAAAVEIFRLRKTYGRQLVLNDLSLTVRLGEVVALLGPSGSGKSTLLRCINHIEEWDAGTIRVTGRRLGFDAAGRALGPKAVADERARVGVGMVFQQFNLFAHLTAKENIAGPLRWVHGMPADKAERRAIELLERVGLAHRADALPRHMSGGQQQRVAIARAVAPGPNVLLLDEPTSALDPELVSEVLDVIRRLAVEEGLTMIISTHQLRFAEEVADRVLFLAGGSIVEEGPAQEILSRPKNTRTRRFLQIMGASEAV
ncbi:amino acid ABC transporter permease/ATP-binding protein [Mangrovibrevibacter kandeliae]|uniref:amino acid ABC transporter permease/ATP-binding protein n=1 Tax=Mangrovibrevibacter kandeliae TaxID=2968473 RepID=UPI002118F27E|nr:MULTISPECIES: amino acid ABC transporter permease/ATP-binding protein [unclassified Aurantimonas]MCQ8781592.1 amino acid ABC transporter permease/ATP-binding protein [Aurantimonas sp. CSK15Z-1]MCW4114962.1 amino acid ABC transporter permease/ATP-binding protein [Aurantimonas sp. MSK8Z-1]